MVIVCAVSDGYYLPAPLTLLYASRLLSPSRPSFPLSYSHCMSLALTDSLFCSVMLHPCPLSLLHFPLLLFGTYFHFSRPSSHRSRFLSFASCYLSNSLLHRCKYSNLIYKKLLKSRTRKVDHVETYPSICHLYKVRLEQIPQPLNL